MVASPSLAEHHDGGNRPRHQHAHRRHPHACVERAPGAPRTDLKRLRIAQPLRHRQRHDHDGREEEEQSADLGPEAVAAGGDLVAEGTTELIVQVGACYTGKLLRELLPRRVGRAAAGRC